MGYPVTDDRQHLVGVANLGRNNQSAILQLLFDDLIGDELAALEIACNLRGNLEHDFILFFIEPDAVLFSQRLVDTRVGIELRIQLPQAVNLAKSEGFDPICITASEIPDALVIDQLVWGDCFVMLLAFAILVVEADVVPAHDGVFQNAELGFLSSEVFVIVAFHQQCRLDSGIEDISEEVI